jgi:hypothetical protein
MLYFLIGGLATVPLIAWGIDSRRKSAIRKEIMNLLKVLEEKYIRLRNQHVAIAMSSQGEESQKMREFGDKVKVIILPELEALIDNILLYGKSDIKFHPADTLFPNLFSLANEWTQGSKTSEESRKQMRNRMEKAVWTSIQADIENRVLNWEAGRPFQE